MGERLRILRKLHRLTQAELAHQAGVSTSLISKVESGQRMGSWDLAVAVAKSLRIDVMSLMDHPVVDAGEEGRVLASLPALRHALAVYDFPPHASSPHRSLGDLSHVVKEASRYRLSAQYVKLSELLPHLIIELTQAAHINSGRSRERAFWLLAAAYRCADAVAYKLGKMDLSMTAIDRIRWAAEQSSDPLMIATAAYVRGQTYFVTRAYESGLRALSAAGNDIEHRAVSDPKAAAVYGALQMRAAVMAARGGKAAEAWSHLEIAKTMTALVTRDVEWYYTSFGPSNVRIHEVAVAVELGDEREALRRVGRWSPPATIPAERASHHLIDLARAQLWAADYPSTLRSLLTARRIAPQHTKAHPKAVETTRALLDREQRRTDTTLGLAAWMGITT